MSEETKLASYRQFKVAIVTSIVTNVRMRLNLNIARTPQFPVVIKINRAIKQCVYSMRNNVQILDNFQSIFGQLHQLSG